MPSGGLLCYAHRMLNSWRATGITKYSTCNKKQQQQIELMWFIHRSPVALQRNNITFSTWYYQTSHFKDSNSWTEIPIQWNIQRVFWVDGMITRTIPPRYVLLTNLVKWSIDHPTNWDLCMEDFDLQFKEMETIYCKIDRKFHVGMGCMIDIRKGAN